MTHPTHACTVLWLLLESSTCWSPTTSSVPLCVDYIGSSSSSECPYCCSCCNSRKLTRGKYHHRYQYSRTETRKYRHQLDTRPHPSWKMFFLIAHSLSRILAQYSPYCEMSFAFRTLPLVSQWERVKFFLVLEKSCDVIRRGGFISKRACATITG